MSSPRSVVDGFGKRAHRKRPAAVLLPIAFLPLLGLGLYLGHQSVDAATSRLRDSDRILTEIRALTNRLDSLEWQAIATGARASDELTQIEGRVAADLARFEEMRNTQTAAEVRRRFATYSDALDAEMAALAAGDTAAAARVDEERVDPAFDRLRAALASESARAARAATRADHVEALATAGLVGIAIGAMALLLWLFDRARRAAYLRAAEHRALRETHDERRRLLEGIVQAREDERSRIAVTLHNGPVQRLTALDLMLERLRLRNGSADPDGDALTVRVQDELRQQILALRGLMTELRPPSLNERGLRAALGDLADSLAGETGVGCTFECELDGRLDPDVETVIYRVVQEALANVRDHAGAGHAWLVLREEEGSVVIDVRDDGEGFDPGAVRSAEGGGSLGLASIRERVEMSGGTWELTSAPGSGTRIRGTIPLSPTSEEASA